MFHQNIPTAHTATGTEESRLKSNENSATDIQIPPLLTDFSDSAQDVDLASTQTESLSQGRPDRDSAYSKENWTSPSSTEAHGRTTDDKSFSPINDSSLQRLSRSHTVRIDIGETGYSNSTIEDTIEDGTQSELSLENAPVLEARLQTLTRLTPSPLHIRRPALSPIPELEDSTRISDGSTTLVEVRHPLYQSPTSSGDQGFSPYAEDSGSSHRWSVSPAERLPFAQLNPSLVGASTSAQPSPLREVVTSTIPPKILSLENFDPSSLPSSHQPIAVIVPDPSSNRGSIDLSSPLHVPLRHILSTTPTETGRVNATEILVAMNAFLSHATPIKRERFVASVQTLLAAHGQLSSAIPHNGMTPDMPSSPGLTISQMAEAIHDLPSSPPCVPAIPLDPTCSPIHSASEIPVNEQKREPCGWETSSTVSDAIATLEHSASSLSRMEILDQLMKNNDNLREMAMSWNVAEDVSPSPTASPTTPAIPRPVARSSFSGPTAASLARSHAVQTETSPIAAGTMLRSPAANVVRTSDNIHENADHSGSPSVTRSGRTSHTIQTRHSGATNRIGTSRAVFESQLPPPSPTRTAKLEISKGINKENRQPASTPNNGLKLHLRAPLPAPESSSPLRASDSKPDPSTWSTPKSHNNAATRRTLQPKEPLTQKNSKGNAEEVTEKRLATQEASRLYDLVQSQAEATSIDLDIKPFSPSRGEDIAAFTERYDIWLRSVRSHLDRMENLCWERQPRGDF